MKSISPIFSKDEMLFCSVPVPPINNHKGGEFNFTDTQISKYGQSQTHPSIVYVPEGWNGHQYWLVSTPYPNAIGEFENPCIYYADAENGNFITLQNYLLAQEWESDAANEASAFLSLSTDNAKELALAKLNAGT